MAKLGYQPKILLPEGEFFRFEILSADIEDGEYGYQLGLELKTLGGMHAGHTFKDWSKPELVRPKPKSVARYPAPCRAQTSDSPALMP